MSKVLTIPINKNNKWKMKKMKLWKFKLQKIIINNSNSINKFKIE